MLGSRIAYTLCMIAATVVAGLLLRRRQTGLFLPPLQRWGIAIGGLIGATFAAKIPFILSVDPDTSLLAAWLSDGKTILWGLTGGYIGVELAKWSLLVKKSTGDTFVVPVAIAIAIGRVGCLLFGCCYGVPTDQSWGIAFVTAPDGGDLLRHPTQIYEIVFHLSFALIAWASINRGSIDPTSTNQGGGQSLTKGNWMPIYLISYAAFRFATEYIRPEIRLAAGLTLYQWSAMVIAAGFSALLVARYRSRHATDYHLGS
ncbi:prolipoprotein diacylglyceryl transferase [Planctomycetes bacterium K23_9]|uniref:Prolipoprotein diacylglyceryl transferase n=1 Tax=Stieleria marina TaxID=1930275 RepID=A0A517NU45_9BACT|nr:prolipoprotein diacylglyceryl transferase [Planctomycetes bacterium K23_9]